MKDAKVKVELNTDPAKSELKKLAKEGKDSAGRVNDALGGGFGRAATLGAAAGVGFGLAQRAASRVAGFMPDVISEATVGFRSGIDISLGGPEARAAKSAREQTKSAYAEIIGRMKEPTVTPGMRNYYNNVRELREITERGNAAIDEQLGGNVVKDAFEMLVEAITSGFQDVINALPLGGR
tara:strand:+ start:1373 stop:1915 length:543 start_codon:yes stop_codon:yes gene_type:complete